MFVDDGATVLTETFFPSENFTRAALRLSPGVTVEGASWRLRSTDFDQKIAQEQEQ